VPEFTGALANAWGRYYPKGWVVAVIHERAQAEQAAEELRAAGFADEDVRLFSGEEVLELDRAFNEQRSLGQRLGALLPSDEGAAQQEYLEEARRGHHFVLVHASGPETERARSVLASHRAHAMRHYGDLAITDLGA
jgi:hypothetical protein